MHRAISIVAAATVLHAPTVRAGAQSRPPNIVVIVADDMGYARHRVHTAARTSRRRTSMHWRQAASASPTRT